MARKLIRFTIWRFARMGYSHILRIQHCIGWCVISVNFEIIFLLIRKSKIENPNIGQYFDFSSKPPEAGPSLSSCYLCAHLNETSCAKTATLQHPIIDPFPWYVAMVGRKRSQFSRWRCAMRGKYPPIAYPTLYWSVLVNCNFRNYCPR